MSVARSPLTSLSPDRARRMRLVATGLLVGMAMLFALSRHFAGTTVGWAHDTWSLLRAFSEAALVGGLADWFAVTALFRHPLGLPIPHTAIIPANKDRIADTMASFLRAHFLTPQVVSRRLRGMNLAAAAGAFLNDPQRMGEARLRKGAATLLSDMLQSPDGEQLGAMLKSAARHQLERVDIATLAGQLLAAAIADKRHLPLIESVLRWTGFTLADNEDLLRAMIHDRAGSVLRWTGLDERLANALLDGTYRLLAECLVNPDHPLRLKTEARLESLAHDLVHDQALRAKVSAMRTELLANPAIAAWLDGLWHRARAAMLRAARDPGQALSGQFGAGLATFGQTLQADASLQRLVNRFARRMLVGIAARHGMAIVTLVSETVKRWDSRTVTDRIEGAVGRDLQFIRLNGTLVGGTVGLVLYAIDRLI
ncbi:MAG: DUF445 domain-containing protein [Pseudomonadota bacterium]|nr:DUF445 domain-containing protein [Pseudomonadota bacterium]